MAKLQRRDSAEVRRLVDEAYELHKQEKKIKRKLEDLKERLKFHAQQHNLNSIEGYEEGMAVFSPNSSSEVDVPGLITLCKDFDQEAALPLMVKGQVEPIRKFFGTKADHLITTTTTQQGKISFRAREE